MSSDLIINSGVARPISEPHRAFISQANHALAMRVMRVTRVTYVALATVAGLGLIFVAYCLATRFSGIHGLLLADFVKTPLVLYEGISLTAASTAGAIALGIISTGEHPHFQPEQPIDRRPVAEAQPPSREQDWENMLVDFICPNIKHREVIRSRLGAFKSYRPTNPEQFERNIRRAVEQGLTIDDLYEEHKRLRHTDSGQIDEEIHKVLALLDPLVEQNSVVEQNPERETGEPTSRPALDESSEAVELVDQPSDSSAGLEPDHEEGARERAEEEESELIYRFSQQEIETLIQRLYEEKKLGLEKWVGFDFWKLIGKYNKHLLGEAPVNSGEARVDRPIVLSGVEVMAPLPPQNEQQALEFLLKVGRDKGFVTRLALPSETRDGYNYIPGRPSQPLQICGTEISLKNRENIQLGDDGNVYATIETLAFTVGEENFQIPIYTYYNLGNLGQPSKYPFLDFIRLTSRERAQERREYVVCTDDRRRTAIYLLCKYSDAEADKPSIMADFYRMREAGNHRLYGTQFCFVAECVLDRHRISTSLSRFELSREDYEYVLGDADASIVNFLILNYLNQDTVSSIRALANAKMTYNEFVELVEKKESKEKLRGWGLQGVSAANLVKNHPGSVEALVMGDSETNEEEEF